MAELIAKIAGTKGDRPALVDEYGSTTWAELDDRVARLGVILDARPTLTVGPVTVHSSAADPGQFPTRRLARRSARWSIGPDGGTPISQYPTRPG